MILVVDYCTSATGGAIVLGELWRSVKLVGCVMIFDRHIIEKIMKFFLNRFELILLKK